MEGEREVAVGAFDDVAAAAAHLHSMRAAPVEKKERLFAHFEPFFQCVEQLFGKMGESARFFHRFFHVDDLNGGELG